MVPVLSGLLSFAQAPKWNRAQSMSNAILTRSAVDTSGNIYRAGDFRDPSITVGSGTFINKGISSLLVAKYDSAGTVLWAISAGGNKSIDCRGITVSSSGDIYVTGSFNDTVVFDNSVILISNGTYDIYLAKYDAAGNFIWAKSAGGSLGDFSASVATDAGDNVYLTGEFKSSTIVFGSTTLSNPGSNYNMFFVKYGPSGNVIWARSSAGNSYASGSSVKADNNGNMYVTGVFGTSIIFGPDTLLSNGSNDIFLAKYDTDGTPVWGFGAGGPDNEGGEGLEIDAGGNIYVTGSFYSLSINFGTFVLTNKGLNNNADLIISKFDAAGNIEWVKNTGGPGTEGGDNLALDAAGNLYVAGTAYLTKALLFGNESLQQKGGFDGILLVYEAATGNELWGKIVGGSSHENAFGICADKNRNVYLSGFFTSPTLGFDGIVLNNSGKTDSFFARLWNSFGVPTGISDQSRKAVSVYPNPSAGHFRITVPQGSERIQILNSLGQYVTSMDVRGVTVKEFDLEQPGIYFIHITGNFIPGVISKLTVIK
jgi:hypothetical protein